MGAREGDQTHGWGPRPGDDGEGAPREGTSPVAGVAGFVRRHANVFGPIAVVLGIAALVAFIMVGSSTIVGRSGLVALLVTNALFSVFEVVLLVLLVGVGVMCLRVADGVAIKVFGCLEVLSLVLLFFSFGLVPLRTTGAAALDLASEPVRMGAEYSATFTDDEGPDSIGILFDDGSYVTWGENMEGALAAEGVGEGDHFEVIAYPHSHHPEALVDSSQYE